jgi:hypothetical protein
VLQEQEIWVFSEAPSFSRIIDALSEGLASAGASEGLVLEIICTMVASSDFFESLPSVLGASAEAGVDVFIDSITAFSMLAILLFLGVVAGMLVALTVLLCMVDSVLLIAMPPSLVSALQPILS